MSFKDWIFSSYPNPSINGRWGLLHILVLLLCIGIVVALSLTMKKKNSKAKKMALWVFAALILLFEITRRIVNFAKADSFTFNSVMHILLPRPWCAISCWALMLCVVANKKFLYNFASMTALLCALIFFAYPGVGFNNQYILFENLYSIATHSLLLVASITLITLKFTKFEYKTIWKEGICLAVILAYVFLEIYGLKIESDPMYFMPGNDVMEIFGVNYPVYLVIYIVFIIIYFNIFYLIDDRKNVFQRRKNKNNDKQIEDLRNFQIIENVLKQEKLIKKE